MAIKTVDFDYIRELTQEQLEDERGPRVEFSSLEWILTQLNGWRKWYCKKNQPKNYFRVTRSIPNIPNAMETPGCWRQRFQIWVKGKLEMDLPIDAKAYDAISELPGWAKGEDSSMSYSIYRNPLFT